MDENNNVMTTAAEQVNNVVAAQQESCPVIADDSVDTGHKVIFYVILGLIGISGIGLPIVIWLLIREHKKRKQLEDTLNAKTAATTVAPAEAPVAQAEAQTEKPAEATPEQK